MNRIKLKIKDVFILVALLAINLLTGLFFLPYVQHDVNGHINSGSFFGIVFYIIAIGLLFFAIYRAADNYVVSDLLYLFALVVTFSYWGYRLYTLSCLVCNDG